MIDRVNRGVLLLLGLALCAAGGAAIAARQRALPLMEPSALYRIVESSIAARPGMWGAATIAVAALVALLGLIYAWRQLAVGGHRAGAILLERTDLGTTRLEPSAVSNAVAADLRRLRDVTGSRVQLRAFLPQPSLAVRLDLDQEANVDHVRAAADEAFQRLCRTLDVGGVDVDMRVRLDTPTPPARVE
jgi:hypothetical protein